ncbi:hypothetical protein [Neobacillus sp. YIM B06451]|uniref:hypothetical protein n=1 Tax=Neobacillus sp. YIM B06451 TaxID=3070994 RepID=UPI00292D08D4|nr:hypothetical protein [Neobacillus sp. YIM B06451]
MFFWYLGLFILAFTMGMLDFSPFLTFLAVALYIIVSIPYIMPLLWSKDTKRMFAYLQKSRNLYYRFLYYLLNGETDSAAQIANKMRAGYIKDMAHAMLYLKEKQFGDARGLLLKMKEGTFKHYYLAVIALEEGDETGYNNHRGQVADKDYRTWLEVEEHAIMGNYSEALSLLDTHISKLRGIKLLSATYYRDELLKRKKVKEG